MYNCIETWILYQGNGKGLSNLVRNAYLDYEVLEFGIKTVDISDSDRHIKLISIAEEKVCLYCIRICNYLIVESM